VFLLPSELESFGLAALEAQACELPVIATRIGGIPEVVNDSETGFLSDVGDVAKMTADTLTLLRNEEMRRSFGEKGRELAIQRYSTDKIIPQYIAFYETIVQKAKAAAA
jgi:glycosyltransferase involved in cell wall biosynthesis